MKFVTPGIVGFLMALATLGQSSASAASPQAAAEPSSVEARLSRITAMLQEREMQLPEDSEVSPPGIEAIARGVWGNGRGGAWGNGGARFANARGPGGFYNVRPGGGWINGGWRDGGRFYNYRY